MLLGFLRQTQQACEALFWSVASEWLWLWGCSAEISRDTLRETDGGIDHTADEAKEPWEQVICMLDDLDSALIQFEVHLVVGVVELPPWCFWDIQMALNSMVPSERM